MHAFMIILQVTVLARRGYQQFTSKIQDFDSKHQREKRKESGY